ncbi:LysM peptidoglycan-binding domain-containing protein [Specibacter sp. NPDC057265]|uniref:LysM peptidoglycan-binding domain-containing protein n=1 Tax=Specibacter sp. NPDC057265 TaxID=3346075 RepID=UPI00363C5162
MTPPRSSTSNSKQLAAVATAAIPVVMLSSLAMAGTATAAPMQAEPLSHGNHGTLDGKKMLAAVQARTSGKSISSTMVASTMPKAVSTLKAATITAAATHTVEAGETLSGIAVSHGVSLGSLLSGNGLSAEDLIQPGQVLAVSGSSTPGSSTSPKAAGKAHIVSSGETLSAIAAEHGVSLAELFSLNQMGQDTVIHPGQSIKISAAAQESRNAPAAAPQPAGSYVIKAGDTLSSIAAEHNVQLSALAAANGTSVNGTIYAGKSLAIPGVAAASSDIVPIEPGAPAPAQLPADQQVPNTFLHYTYPDAVVNDANRNKAALLAAPAPTRGQMQEMVAGTAAAMGVDPALALAFAEQESSFNHQSVSPANAIGTMQVIPDAGEWASGLVGRQLNLLDPQDNVTAGVAIIRALHAGAATEEEAIAGYYQGQYSVSVHGLFPDSVNYVAGIKAKRELYR